MLNEASIIDGCRRNDRKAQNLLFNQFEKKVLGIGMRYASSADEARDIQQEAFIKIFFSLRDAKRSIQSLEQWIHRITVNTAIDHYRRVQSSQQIMVKASGDEVAMPEILDKLNEVDLVRLIQEIPTPYRTVFNLYIVEGMSHKEIGQMMEITESSSRSYLTFAKEFMKEHLLPRYYPKVKRYG